VNFNKFEGFEHAIIFFGGLEGLEGMIEEEAGFLRTENTWSLFDYYINTCPHSGTADLRTEEAVLISLSGILPNLQKIGA